MVVANCANLHFLRKYVPNFRKKCKFGTYFRKKCKFGTYFRKKCKFGSYFRKNVNLVPIFVMSMVDDSLYH